MNYIFSCFQGLRWKTIQAAAIAISAIGFLPTAANTIEMRPYLTLAIAEKAATACHKLAEENGWRMAISIKDTAGNLVFFSRMDDAFSKASEIALLKAETASTTPFSTLDLRRIALEENDLPHGIELVPGIVVFDGGVPIRTAEGLQIGGIGVSGSSAGNDGECARAAVQVIEADLQ